MGEEGVDGGPRGCGRAVAWIGGVMAQLQDTKVGMLVRTSEKKASYRA